MWPLADVYCEKKTSNQGLTEAQCANRYNLSRVCLLEASGLVKTALTLA